ncbi:MAG TPA: efflux RND transporter periplasmic adaptor subunit [Bryobacteraceae bacterium]|nr:efflux RND transporter periplasmic adaptor subunit [Bryobacteraceae bacterium]
MKRVKFFLLVGATLCAALALGGCGSTPKLDAAAAAPPPAQVEEETGVGLIQVSNASQFPVVVAGQRDVIPTLSATGVVNPDVSDEVPVISLAAGRVVDIRAKLGDFVTKGQLLLRILSDDIAAAFQAYDHAKADEELAHKQLERSQILYEHGAIALADYEVAQNVEQKARVDLNVAIDHLHIVGAEINHRDPVVNIYAPITGTIVDQQVTKDSNVKTPDNQQTGLFTISDLAHVWVVCDVYENDLAMVRLGDRVDVKLNGYPDRLYHGTISNIGTILDPAIRTAKVRIQLQNPGNMRVGMFATAVFFGKSSRVEATVPAAAILHLHDRDWVYVPAGDNHFRRVEVETGNMLPHDLQEVQSGINPGQKVVERALVLESAVTQ